MLHLIGKGIVAVGLFIGSLFGYSLSQQPLAGTYSPSGGGTYRLGQSIGTSDTTIRLSSFKEPVSNIAYTMSYLGASVGYGTVSPQSSVSEFISFTGITQNSDGSATLTGVTRGLTRTPAGSNCTASTTLAQPHPGQSIFILSDSPCHFAEYAVKQNNENISGIFNFQALPTSTLTCSSQTQFCTKGYIDSVANQGAATSTETNGGIVRLGTLAEQANSYNGQPRDPAVVQTKNSTSTCQVVGSYNIIASSTTGKLDKNCFDQTASYSLSSTSVTTFRATNATTTTGLDVQGKLHFQTSSASSTVLSIDASGYVSAVTPQVAVLLATSTPTGSNSSAATTTVRTLTLAANTLSQTSILELHTQMRIGPTGTSDCSYDISLGTGSASTTIASSFSDSAFEGTIIATTTAGILSNFISYTSLTPTGGAPTLGNYNKVEPYSTAGILYLGFAVRAQNNSTCNFSSIRVVQYNN